MVKYLSCIILFIFCPLSVALASHAPARTIIEVKITETGKSEDDTKNVQEGCRTFTITADDVKRFFASAWPVPTKFIVHDRYSPCYATGRVEFSDNTRGTWKIASGGGGTLFWDTGEVVTLFYNDYSWADPFAGTYSPED